MYPELKLNTIVCPIVTATDPDIDPVNLFDEPCWKPFTVMDAFASVLSRSTTLYLYFNVPFLSALKVMYFVEPSLVIVISRGSFATGGELLIPLPE